MEAPSPISNPGELTEKSDSVIAAVDLGSNSFHMVVAQDQHGQLKVVDRLREMVRLGAGLNASGKLSKESKQRAIACLQRFGQRLQEMHADSVRVVGTNTLRVAKNSEEFIQRAEEELGHPIQIISGVEEARLIYQGTIHSLTGPEGKWLVVDIGGGSTEIIIGKQAKPLLMESVQMGCVVISEKYFSDGVLEKKKFKKALVAAKLQLQPIVSPVKDMGWKHVVGTAGTIRAIAELMREFELSERGITYKGINELIGMLQEAKHIDKVNFNSLAKERKPVFGYHVDFNHAAQIKTTALHLLEKIAKVRKIDNTIAYQFLIWAADLHEIGLDIAHSKYHRHGAYLLDNSDLMGFSWNEQKLLACLVGNHRRKIFHELIDQLPKRWYEPAMYMIVIFRIAVLIHRDRVPKKLPDIKIEDEDGVLSIKLDQKWLEAHPLTVAELEQEQNYLKALKLKVSI